MRREFSVSENYGIGDLVSHRLTDSSQCERESRRKSEGKGEQIQGNENIDARDENGDADESVNDKSNNDGAFDDVGLCGMSDTDDVANGYRRHFR
ncbi:hypothetical protein GBA52_014932 [Prunus armeniaca]|nr:hypothetical protein GBA52_014932 [Prunus armeniaca]